MMKKIIGLALLLVLIVAAFSSCGRDVKAAKECSDEVVSLMQEMVSSEKYASEFSHLGQKEELLNTIKDTDFLSPSAIYELTIPKEELNYDNWEIEEEYTALNSYMDNSFYKSFASLINEKCGVDAVSFAAVFSPVKTFVCDEITKTTTYLYTYEGSCPIVVTFVPGESGSVSVSANFIVNEEFFTSDIEKIISLCKENGIDGVSAQKK